MAAQNLLRHAPSVVVRPFGVHKVHRVPCAPLWEGPKRPHFPCCFLGYHVEWSSSRHETVAETSYIHT